MCGPFLAHSKTLNQQAGQSLVEALVLFLVLLVIFSAIPWLGRLSDIALQESQASRYAAFQLTRHEGGIDESDLKTRFFTAGGEQWKDRQQKNIVPEEVISLSLTRVDKLSSAMQPGGQGRNQNTLREEWQLEDEGIARVSVVVKPQYSQSNAEDAGVMSPRLSFFDNQVISLHRHSAILTGLGHQASDSAAHKRTAESALAWSEAAEASYETGKRVAEVATHVDAAWPRANPVFDWLQPWEGHLPSHHLE